MSLALLRNLPASYLTPMHNAKRILLVEDDLDDQFLFNEALSRLHPSVRYEIAHDGAEALKMLEESQEYDYIFLDLNMPKMNGFECLLKIKNNPATSNIPVIIISTSNRPVDIQRCKELGAAGYFTKPPSFDELFNSLSNIVSKGSLGF